MQKSRLNHISYAVGPDTGPWLFLVGAPAGMSGFTALADELQDRYRVVLHDPRGVGGSTIPVSGDARPQSLASDLISLINHLGAEGVSLFGASGGAITVLACLARSSSGVSRAILHEPPLFGLIPDGGMTLAEADRAFSKAMTDPQQAFQQFVDLTEVLHSTNVEAPRPAPTVLPPLPENEMEKQRFALGVMSPGLVHYDVDAGRLPAGKVVIAAGRESIGQPARRAAVALAELLIVAVEEAPGNHLAPSTRAPEFGQWLDNVLRPSRDDLVMV